MNMARNIDSGNIPEHPAGVAPQYGEADQVLRALRQIIHAIDIQSKKTAKETGLTGPQFVVLKAVADLGEVTTRALAQHVSLSQPTVTIMLDRLEQRGFVERYRSETDRRIVHTRLTETGKRTVRNAPPLLQDKFMTGFGALAPERRREILSALETVARMMEADDLDASPVLTLASSDVVQSPD